LPDLVHLSLTRNSVCKDTNINYSSQLEGQISEFPNCPPLATVKVQLNQSHYTTGNPIRLDMQVKGQAIVDLYVAIVFPDGDFMTIANPLAFSWPNAIQVYQPNVEIAGQKTYPIMDFSLTANIAKGQYQAYGVLVTAGTDPNDQNNWIHFDSEGFEVY